MLAILVQAKHIVKFNALEFNHSLAVHSCLNLLVASVGFLWDERFYLLDGFGIIDNFAI